MRRLLVDHIAGETLVLAGEQHHRITRVLRLRSGDALRIFDGRGSEWEAVIESLDRARVTLRLGRPVQPTPEPRIKLVLFQSIPRGDAMERVIQKCVEIGVADIVPVVTRRTVARPRAGEQSAKLARWRKIALHAVEQSGRTWLVPIAEPVRVEAVVDGLRSADLALVPHATCCAAGCHAERPPRVKSRGSEESCSATNRAIQPIRDALSHTCPPQSVAIVIGPEGGFSPDEIERFAAARARIVSLGPRVLRSETAGLVAAAIVLYHFGEMG